MIPMLSISSRTTSCARLTQSFARFSLGTSRGYAKAPPTVQAKKPKIGKGDAPPKKPIGSYARFILENRHLVNSDENAFRALASKWAEMGTAEKKKYNSTPQEWEKYHEELNQWKEKADPEVLREVNIQRKKKGLKPFRTVKLFANSYALYLKEFYATTKAEGGVFEVFGSIGTRAAEKWRTMSDEEKQVYKDKAAAAKEEWQKTHGKTEGEV